MEETQREGRERRRGLEYGELDAQRYQEDNERVHVG